MEELFKAIYTRWATIVGATPLYNTQGPEKATFPYGTVTIIGDNPDFGFDGDLDESVMFQFNIFSKNATCEAALDLFELVKTAFDKFDLVITGATTISLVRQLANLQKIEEVWQITVTYMIQYEI